MSPKYKNYTDKYGTDPRIAYYLRRLINKFNQDKIQYCIMGGYENLPSTVKSDVDIAIDKNTFNKLDSLLVKISSDNNVEIVQKIWHGYNKCAYILSPLAIDYSFRLQLDFFTDFSAKGYPNLIPSEILLKKRVKYKKFFVPEPEVEVPFLIMRRIIKNDFNVTHIKKLNSLIRRNPEKIKNSLCKFLGSDLGTQIIKIIESGNLNAFSKNIRTYRKALKKYSNFNTNVYYRITYALTQAIRIFNRLRHPVGLSVAFIGPDGSGKSTIANLVLERVSGSFHGAAILYWRPNLFAAMGQLKFWNPPVEIKINPTPHDHPKQNFIKSLARFLYYLTDYLIGYLIKVYWGKVKKKILIFDRYYYDYLVDLHRYHFNIPGWLPKLILPIIPAPDLVFYLEAEPERIFDRKQELSLVELRRQVDDFSLIVRTIPNAYTIKTNKSIEETAKQIAALILKKKKEITIKLIKDHN